jgi:hypothetical protein
MPLSTAIYGRDYQRHVDLGLAPEQFRYRFLAEGDSWMDRSSALSGSLPQYLALEMEARGEPTLIVNVSMAGHTMRHIGETVRGEMAGWLDFMAFDAILLSAGGNDFIDAARDPAPGQGILRDLRGKPQPPQGYDCAQRAAITKLVTAYLDPNFDVLYNAVRASTRNADTPIFLNNYDTPVARNAPAPPGRRAWLYDAYTANGIDPSLWPDVTDGLFNDIQSTVAGWQKDRSGVFGVPTDGTLAPADPASTGDSGDWINEIHPNRKGWRKLAPIWARTLRAVL